MATERQANPKKVDVLNALAAYFYSRKQFQKKPYTCYVLYNGPKVEVYLKWEKLVPLIEEIKLFPKYGMPPFKGFFDIQEAIDSVIKNCGKISYTSPKVLKYQKYLKHLEEFEDPEFLKEISDSKIGTTSSS
nr:hypothetical protein Iba_chr14eCG7100 [Ipomoea batatas]